MVGGRTGEKNTGKMPMTAPQSIMVTKFENTGKMLVIVPQIVVVMKFAKNGNCRLSVISIVAPLIVICNSIAPVHKDNIYSLIVINNIRKRQG